MSESESSCNDSLVKEDSSKETTNTAVGGNNTTMEDSSDESKDTAGCGNNTTVKEVSAGEAETDTQKLPESLPTGAPTNVTEQPPTTDTGSCSSSPTDSTLSPELIQLKTSDSPNQTTQSSVGSVSAEYLCRLQSQADRMDSFKSLRALIKAHSRTAGVSAYEQWTRQLEQLLKEFKDEHAKLEETCTAEFYQHAYFKQRTLFSAERRYTEIAFELALIKDDLLAQGKFTPTVIQTSSNSEPPQPRMPEIKLSKFSGSCGDWPAYKETYQSIILDNKQLTELDKLNYLRGSLAQEPLALIESLPLADSSLKLSLDMLTKRYEDQQYIVHSYLEILLSTAPAQIGDVESLKLVTSAFGEAHQALRSLINKRNLADLMLASLLVRLLDEESKKAWETHTNNWEGECNVDQLCEFLASRTRSPERIDDKASAQTASHAAQAKARANVNSDKTGPIQQSSAHSNNTSTPQDDTRKDSSYPCSVCYQAGHYVVMCPRFKDLTIEERKGIAVTERLCYNCLGRHSVRNCRSQLQCKVCSQRHHTMLHSDEQLKSN